MRPEVPTANSNEIESLRGQARKVRRYRIPLIVAFLVAATLVIRVPLTSSKRSGEKKVGQNVARRSQQNAARSGAAKKKRVQKQIASGKQSQQARGQTAAADAGNATADTTSATSDEPGTRVESANKTLDDDIPADSIDSDIAPPPPSESNEPSPDAFVAERDSTFDSDTAVAVPSSFESLFDDGPEDGRSSSTATLETQFVAEDDNDAGTLPLLDNHLIDTTVVTDNADLASSGGQQPSDEDQHEESFDLKQWIHNQFVDEGRPNTETGENGQGEDGPEAVVDDVGSEQDVFKVPDDDTATESTAQVIDADQQTDEDSGEDRTTALVLRNRPSTNTVVHFLVDGEHRTMKPGEVQEFFGAETWFVQFHRGGSFGYVQLHLKPGVYAFHGTQQGWALTEVGPESKATGR